MARQGSYTNNIQDRPVVVGVGNAPHERSGPHQADRVGRTSRKLHDELLFLRAACRSWFSAARYADVNSGPGPTGRSPVTIARVSAMLPLRTDQWQCFRWRKEWWHRQQRESVRRAFEAASRIASTRIAASGRFLPTASDSNRPIVAARPSHKAVIQTSGPLRNRQFDGRFLA